MAAGRFQQHHEHIVSTIPEAGWAELPNVLVRIRFDVPPTAGSTLMVKSCHHSETARSSSTTAHDLSGWGLWVSSVGTTEWLFDRAEALGRSLQRNWLLQVTVAALGILYTSNSELALGLAGTLHLTPDLAQKALPFVSVYLFVEAGYLLGGFIQLRTELLERAPATPGVRESVYLARAVTVLLNPQERRPTTIAPDPAVSKPSWATRIERPITLFNAGLLFAVFMVVQGVSMGTATYLAYRLVWSPWGWGFLATWDALLTVFTLHFLIALWRNMNKPVRALILAPVVLTIGLGLLLVKFDPFDPSSGQATPPHVSAKTERVL